MPWLLLPYTTTTQALSATTAEVINGSEPYLTFDNGVTKVTTTEGLLSITISDGTTQTTYTPGTNTSTSVNPIVLPVANQSFADIGMLIPTNTNSIALSTLISAPNNYWGDDDGDGQGANGITATGTLRVSITDKKNQTVSRSAILDGCQAPYRVELTSTDGSLITQYGVPNSRNFSGGTATYYVSPKMPPKICYAKPVINWSNNNYAGPADIWTPRKGFLPQSIDSSSYDRNFPTTGADNLYFDLDIGGVNTLALTWPTVTQGGITATMKNYYGGTRVTLTGPVATESQWYLSSPGSIATPTLPQTFVLVGKDSSNSEVLRYGFVLKHWFVNRGYIEARRANHLSWCSNLGGGYRLPQIRDLTNAVCSGSMTGSWCEGVVAATPPSPGNHYQRNIGAGLLSEWGDMQIYANANFPDLSYVTSDYSDSTPLSVSSGGRFILSDELSTINAVCVYP